MADDDGRVFERNILGFDLFMTCGACPEQYDVEMGGKPVGYLRLRHGHFTACYPDPSGSLVYEASPAGDGIFDDDERDYYLTKAIIAIKEFIDLIEKVKQHANSN